MKQPRAFITGIAGFAGSFLAEELLAHNYKVSGSLMERESSKNIKSILNELDLVKLDVQKPSECTRRIKQLNPDYIFHLAAFSSVGQSFKNETLTYKVNFEGTLNVLNAALEVKNLSKLVFISSADCYGAFKPANKTLTEKQPFNPISPYAVSKTAAELLCNFYVSRYNAPLTIARSFNHTGPRQNDNFVVSSFARQIAQIEKNGGEPIIHVGDLSAKRDFSDVRDIVSGYRLLAEKGRAGESYHFCSGKTVTVKQILEMLLKMSDKTIIVKTDNLRLRKNDIPCLKGDNKKAKTKLRFQPKYSLNETLQDTLNYWRENLLQ
jgi:GDP-4-dehydro-6-deoxy-D-mannose reductase